MTTRQTSIDEDDFQAFVDGQLPPERCRAVMAFLAANPEEAARMDDYRNLSEALHLAYDEVLYEPLPKRLRVEHYRGGSSFARRLQDWFGVGRHGLVARLAGVAVLLLASSGGGWMLHSEVLKQDAETPAMSFARQAANAHLLYAPDLRHPVEFGADQQDSMLLWLSERMGEALHAPNLQTLGLKLVGGRLLPAASQPAAQLMYENADARRVTLYIRARWTTPVNGAHDGTVSFASEDGFSMVYWIEGPFAYALIGTMDREKLFSAAKLIQQQMSVPTLPATPATDQTATAEKDAT
jgi:anti-sigma factor RsiW